MRILSHALPVYIFDPVCPLFLLLYNPAAPRHYLLTALLYMPKGLFCQIPHRGQRPPSLPYRSPGFQSSLGYNLIPPSPIPKSIHLIHLYLSIYLSISPSLHSSIVAGWSTCLPPHSVAAYQFPAVLCWFPGNTQQPWQGSRAERAPCFAAARYSS